MAKKQMPAELPLFDFAAANANDPSRQFKDASLDVGVRLRQILNDVIRDCAKNRFEIAAEMSRLIFGESGEGEITKTQIDTWTAASREGHRFPLQYLCAFCVATTDFRIFEFMAAEMRLQVQLGEDAALAAIGRAHLIEQSAREKRERLEGSISPEMRSLLLGGQK